MADPADDPYAGMIKQYTGGSGTASAPAAPDPAGPAAAPPATDPYAPMVNRYTGDAAPPQVDPAVQRIRDAATQAFVSAPSLGTRPGNMSVITPETQDWVNRNIPGVGPYLINPLGTLVGTGIGAVAATGAAATQTVNELLRESGVNPQLQRDLNIAAVAVPAAAAEMTAASGWGNRPRLEQAGPSYAGGVSPGALKTTEARQAARSVAVRPLDEPPTPTGAALSSPTGIDGPIPPPPGYVRPVAPAEPITTSAQAKQVASGFYKQAADAGGTLTPQFTDKFIDSVASVAPQTEAGTAVAGTNAVTGLVDRLQALRGQPMTLQAAQEADEALGNLIDKEYGVTGLSKDGRKLLDIQSTLRDQIQNAGPGDITGGTAGFDALAPARQAWSQAMKMGDLERIQTRAALTDNPATSIRTQVRNILSNPSRVRGYAPDELDALTDAANRGTLGAALHVFGSRLLPLAVGAAGLAHGGLMDAVVGGGASHVAGDFMRNWATSIQQNRLGNAINVVGSRVPQAPAP